ncbi:unnamed protein product [Closterium sp. Yama58-4]|nr:unnamed protein product [Closterium sp. Yama58-4]
MAKLAQEQPAHGSSAGNPVPAKFAILGEHSVRDLAIYLVICTLLLCNIFFLSTSTSVWEGDPWDFPMLRALIASGKLRGAAVSVSARQQGANQELWEANNEDSVPSLAYGILGSKNDTDRIYRLLLATYHPRNFYAVYIDDADSAFALRTKLSAHPVLAAAVAAAGAAEATEAGGNGEHVTITGETRASTSSGCSPPSRLSFLHGPCVSPRLSFMDHVVDHRFDYRQESVFADNALFERRRGGRWIADMRDRVTRFEVYTGSFPLLASRPLIRYLIDEPHAIPRRMLMFLGDTLSPHLHYIPTTACQAARFNHTVVNRGLHFPPFTVTQGHEMPPVNSSQWQNMSGGGASGGGPFLFVHDPDPGLVTKIDRELLHREEESAVDCKKWCTRSTVQHSNGTRSVDSRWQQSQRVKGLKIELHNTVTNNVPCEV